MTLSTGAPPRGRQRLTVESLGVAGDGVVRGGQATIFLPRTLPGEQVVVDGRDGVFDIVEIERPSPDRVAPPCPLFGACGGCTLQHMAPPAMAAWKAARVAKALANAGFAPIEPVVSQVAPHTRRRVDLAAQRVPGGMILGLHRRRGEPVDMTTCHVLAPKLFDLLAPLRVVLASLGAITAQADVFLNLLDSGPDILLGTDTALGPADRIKLAAFARAHLVPRIAWRPRRAREAPEIVAQSDGVAQDFSGAAIAPPPGAFLQAAFDGEKAIIAAVLAGLPKLNRRDVIVELYAGCGTLTFALCEAGRVVAYEGEAEAVAALKRAITGRRIEIAARDLGRQPLMAKELSAARVCVLDPPFTGAGPQIAEIALSALQDVIYVSCNPQALEADAAKLRAAGFSVRSVAVVDQFLWSTEVEAIVVFRRENSRRSRNGLSRSG